MGPLHLHRKRDHIHNQHLQEGRHKDNPTHQQQSSRPANAETPTPRQIQQIWSVKTNVSGMQQSVFRSDRQSFNQRFKEHRNAFKSNRNTSNYAKHALDHQHPFGPIQETMQILQYQKKGTHLNTIERFFIFKDYLINNHPNDEFNINTNKFFEAILKT